MQTLSAKGRYDQALADFDRAIELDPAEDEFAPARTEICQLTEHVAQQPCIRGHIDELFASDKQLPVILEQVARLGAQLLMQAALEAGYPSAQSARGS